MEILLATRRHQQQSKHGRKRQVGQHCGGKRWSAARVCAEGRSRGGHAPQCQRGDGGAIVVVVVDRASVDTQHTPATSCCCLLPPTTTPHPPPKILPRVLIVRVANVHRPTTAATAAAAAASSPIHPRTATACCGIDWPSCPSSERRGRSNIRTVAFSSSSYLLTFLPSSPSFDSLSCSTRIIYKKKKKKKRKESDVQGLHTSSSVKKLSFFYSYFLPRGT